MNRINVPITKVVEPNSLIGRVTSPKLIGLFVLILSSVALGAFVEGRYALLAYLHLPNIDPKTQLGALGASLPTTTTTAISPLQSAANALAVNSVAASENAPLIAVGSGIQFQQHLDDLNVLVSEHRDTIIQLNKELELIKDRSVSLIVEFDQNCGNWGDECATPFARELELNNSRYSQLVIKLTAYNQELAKAESERDLLTQ